MATQIPSGDCQPSSLVLKPVRHHQQLGAWAFRHHWNKNVLAHTARVTETTTANNTRTWWCSAGPQRGRCQHQTCPHTYSDFWRSISGWIDTSSKISLSWEKPTECGQLFKAAAPVWWYFLPISTPLTHRARPGNSITSLPRHPPWSTQRCSAIVIHCLQPTTGFVKSKRVRQVLSLRACIQHWPQAEHPLERGENLIFPVNYLRIPYFGISFAVTGRIIPVTGQFVNLKHTQMWWRNYSATQTSAPTQHQRWYLPRIHVVLSNIGSEISSLYDNSFEVSW